MCLEIIHLRVMEPDLDRVIPLFLQLVEEIREKNHCREVKLYRRALVETDVCLHLYYANNQYLGADGSSVGVRLAAALKPFGMVNHTVWLSGEDIAARHERRATHQLSQGGH